MTKKLECSLHRLTGHWNVAVQPFRVMAVSLRALFGTDPKVGLSSTSLPAEVLQTLQSDDDLLAICPNPTEAAAEPSTQPSVIPETSEHEQLTSVSELSVIISESSDNGHHLATVGPTLDMSETLEEEQLMSVLATSGPNCHDSGDCQLPSPFMPSTSHCVTVRYMLHSVSFLLRSTTSHHLGYNRKRYQCRESGPGKHSSAKL